MFYVDIVNDKIVSKNYISSENIILNSNQKEITDDIYNQLTNLPATFETDTSGNIIGVTPDPIPEPPPPEPTRDDYLLDLDYRVSLLELGI